MSASERVEELIARLTDWRGKTLASVRNTIRGTDRGIVEEWKWMGSPVWSCDGMIAVANAHKDKVKVTFSNGAKLPDPEKLFNAGLGGGTWRAIDFSEGDAVNKAALKNLVRAAIEFNRNRPTKKKTPAAKRAPATAKKKPPAAAKKKAAQRPRAKVAKSKTR
jgi:hypothetical protein